MFLQALFHLSASNLCVFPESTLISLGDYIDPRQAIDYSPRRLECHWNTGSDQFLHPGTAPIPCLLSQTHLSTPLYSAVWRTGSVWFCSLSEQKSVCFYDVQNASTFLFFSVYVLSNQKMTKQFLQKSVAMISV